jgi:predicted nuclease of predicted toxin-antitoxin system
MKVLLDECVPRKLSNILHDHECCTVPEEGFAGAKNGELLTLAEKAGFQIFLTIDRGLEYQQNLQARTIAVILVRTRTGRLAELLDKQSEILGAIASARPGFLTKVE